MAQTTQTASQPPGDTYWVAECTIFDDCKKEWCADEKEKKDMRGYLEDDELEAAMAREDDEKCGNTESDTTTMGTTFHGPTRPEGALTVPKNFLAGKQDLEKGGSSSKNEKESSIGVGGNAGEKQDKSDAKDGGVGENK
jgi:hypothetical protein